MEGRCRAWNIVKEHGISWKEGRKANEEPVEGHGISQKMLEGISTASCRISINTWIDSSQGGKSLLLRSSPSARLPWSSSQV